MDSEENLGQWNLIKEGEWFCAVQGFAIAEKVYNFYFEEYDCIPKNNKVGDYKLSVVKYKLFCDFDGHLIRRNRCKIFNMSWCSPMEAKLERVLQRSIKDNPKEYASFVKLLEKPQEMKGWELLEYEISSDIKMKAIQDLERIKNDLPPKFTFPELMKVAENHGCVIDLTGFLKDTFMVEHYIRITLNYTYGDYVGKRVLFHNFDFEIKR